MENNTIQQLAALVKQTTDPEMSGLSQLGILAIRNLNSILDTTLHKEILDYQSALTFLNNHTTLINSINILAGKFEPIKHYLDAHISLLTFNDSISLLSQAYLYQLKLIKSIKFKIVTNLITANCFIINFNLSEVPTNLHSTIHKFISAIQNSLQIATRDEDYQLLNHIFVLFTDLQDVYDNSKGNIPTSTMISTMPGMVAAFESMKFLQRPDLNVG
ncbi:hypothetical protein, no similarity [Maudiozyma barnettii]|uniref:Uncharacterized protein n=1 Tax=Maudiozyma barnettii TaxID=61262 RepID=A0A8H2VB85_9SACH|nr:hypothetical protein, no similarity [Kazachstania barnettii]CAB4252059.1 hypothetical protein, no similarity [Kazachstania barnettii]CAD1778535.1 hypothetical protein, no similarity [Kazachstania barnettii]